MGLTIHWTLENSLNTSTVLAKLHELRSACLDLPFDTVGEVVHLRGSDIKKIHDDRDHALRWAMIQSEGSLVLNRGSGRECWLRVPPLELVGFSTWPGEGCEEANVFIGRFPESVFHEGTGIKTAFAPWAGHSFCKTQYASTVSLPHFLQCHLTVTAMLDMGRELGLVASVNDEGEYWEKRDLTALAQEVGEWNEMIAGLFGELDAAGHTALSPITQHPQFEQLEHRGLQSATTALAAKKIAEIAKRLPR